MAANAVQERSLRELLDGLILSQKQDIHAYSGGHLNEANLRKPQDKASYISWLSAKKKTPTLTPPSKIPKAKAKKGHESDMKDTLVKFSVGTSGSLPPVQKHKKAPKGTKGPVKYEALNSAGTYGRTDDGVLVEELRLPEYMLASPRVPSNKAWANEDLKNTPTSPSQGTIKDVNLVKFKKQFLPSYHDAVTKKDQYAKFKKFETDVLQTEDAKEQNVFSGQKAVQHLENKLQQDLDRLQYNGYGPNFHRLQVYSNIFSDLIDDSPTLGFILSQIKDEYDRYVSSLLDKQSMRHQTLYSQMESLAARGTSQPGRVQSEASRLAYMEQRAKDLLQHNDRLRREVEEELELANQPELEPASRSRVFSEDPPLEVTDQIEELRATILEKLDAMNNLREKLRKEYVPSTVCTHLEQCIKETEVEIQKLTSQKEYFDQSIAEMEKDLKQAIQVADTTDKDAKRVWRKVSAVKRIHTRTPGMLEGAEFIGSDDDEEDESKWSWYIS